MSLSAKRGGARWHLIRQQLADHAGMAAEIAADGVLLPRGEITSSRPP